MERKCVAPDSAGATHFHISGLPPCNLLITSLYSAEQMNDFYRQLVQPGVEAILN